MTNAPNRYSERIQRTVHYLAAQLDKPLDLQSLADVACLSPYHFHRIYRGSLGETVGDTVRRLRLRRSAVDLLDREMNIENAAQRAGYASQAAFTRAFREEYGAPPARYRVEAKEVRNSYEIEIVELPALRVAAIEHRGSYDLTSRTFEQLMAIAATTGLFGPHTRIFGIYPDDPDFVRENELRAAACITVPDAWEPTGELMQKEIDGGRYARIVHTGAYSELRHAYDWLYQTWLPASDDEPHDLPCLEEYLNDARQVSAKDLKTAIMMPIAG